MLHTRNLSKTALCLILFLTCLCLITGCANHNDEQVAVEQEEEQTTDNSKFSGYSISSAEYSDLATVTPAKILKTIDSDTLLHLLELQSVQLQCPYATSDDSVFVQIQLPKQWTQNTDDPTHFYFPDGTEAMQIELLPIIENGCIWSTERLWEDQSCVYYEDKWIDFSWNEFYLCSYSFMSIHTTNQKDIYDYTYYLPYGDSYFAIHWYTAGDNNSDALRLQKAFLETMQLLTPIPNQIYASLSGEFWKATVTLSCEENDIEITLSVPIEWAQEKPESYVFYNSNSIICISYTEIIELKANETVWDIAEQNEQLLQCTAFVNGTEIPRAIFTPPYKPGEDTSEEYGSYTYFYYIPIDNLCLIMSFHARGMDNQQAIQLHQTILESIAIQ